MRKEQCRAILLRLQKMLEGDDKNSRQTLMAKREFFFFQTINLVAINNLNSGRFSATDSHSVLNLTDATRSHAHELLYRRNRLSIGKRRRDRNGVVSFYLLRGLCSAYGEILLHGYPPFPPAFKSLMYALYAEKSPYSIYSPLWRNKSRSISPSTDE